MSYLEHFNLSEQPFRLTPDPEFVYWSKQHARAKAYMESTIWLADGFVVITGEIGSGKTTLLQSFLSELDDDVVYAVVSQTQLNANEFLQAILTEFGFKPFGKEKVELLDMLNMFLLEQYSNGKKVLLIVDEAQNLSRRVLEEIRLLSGIETHKEKVLRIILAGQPELKGTLESPRLKQLVQRVRLRFHLGPLDRRELQEYVEHRVEVAGGSDLFTEDSFDRIHKFTGGVPRLINTLCDTALLCAFADEKDSVSGDDVDAAIAELNWKEHPNTTGMYKQLSERPARRNSNEDPVMELTVHCEGELIGAYSYPPGRVVVGRSPDNELYIKSKFVSRHHASFVADDEGCSVQDLKSTNGVFVDDEQISNCRLDDGDVVSLGIHEITYRDLRRDDESSEDDTTEEPLAEFDEDDDARLDDDSSGEDELQEEFDEKQSG